MRFLLLATTFFLSAICLMQAQVTKRDTLIEWSHFAYQMNADYGLESYSQDDIVTSTFNGIVLENEYVKLCLIPEFGARIISFVYKPTGQEQLYQNPVGVPYQIDSRIFYHDWLMVYGGIFPTFPEPEHGKYWNVPWNENILTESQELITISMSLKDELENPVRPGQYNNGVTGITCYFDVSLAAGQPYFTVDVRLENDDRTARYEYWTCLTLAPGSDIGNTFTPSASEMIVPIAQYEVAWNPGNWMNGLDEVVSSGNPRIQVYDRLAHLSNWKDMGIAYAYPDMKKDFYGVINHTNEQGVFRLSSDQSTTPGLKFWTWGDERGLNADPTDFNNEARPYIELWSGVSQAFFEDATLAPNASIQWQEHYLPTIGMPDVSFLNQEISFAAHFEDQEITLHAFQAIQVDSDYELSIEVLNQNGLLVNQMRSDVTPDLLKPTVQVMDLEALSLQPGNYTIQASLIQNGQVLYQEPFEYQEEGEVDFDPTITLENGTLVIGYGDAQMRQSYLFDLSGREIDQEKSAEPKHFLRYPGYGIYIINVYEDGRRWSKKIQILND